MCIYTPIPMCIISLEKVKLNTIAYNHLYCSNLVCPPPKKKSSSKMFKIIVLLRYYFRLFMQSVFFKIQVCDRSCVHADPNGSTH